MTHPKTCEISQTAACGKVDELAMLVRQLVHSLRKASPGNDLADRALGYLKRHGLTGTVLRGNSAFVPENVPSDQDAPITWPKARDVGRIGDMSQVAHIRVGFDSDNDVFVSVWDENGGGSIEFCNPGGGGDGQSSRTRMALIALMVAMEADNVEKPSRDWWAQRAAIAAAKGEQQS